MCHYSHKSFTIHIERAKEDGFLSTIDGEFPVKVNDLIGTNEQGDQFIVTEEYFHDNYIPVKKMRKTKTVRKSPFEIAYAEQLSDFSLDSNFESDEYINEMKNLINNKVY